MMGERFKNIKWKRIKKEVAEDLLDILFPRFCFGCGKEGRYICEQCELFLSENNLICPICGEPSFTGKTDKSCSTKYSLDGLVSVWDYEGVIRKAILAMKGSGNYHAGEKIMEKAFSQILLTQNRFYDFLNFLLDEETKITFVPAHKKKTKKLRIDLQNIYENNHSEELAKILARIIPEKKEVISTLKKKKETKKQSQLTRKERLKNVKKAFKVKKREIPQNLVLVDDIFTTGATMRECGKTLKKEGVKNVWGFTLARTI